MRGDRVRFALGDHVELREPLSLSSTDVLADSGWQRRWSDADRRMDVRPATDNDPWPAQLPPPTEVVLVDAPAAAGDPAELVREHGTDAVRWWLLRAQGTTLPRTAKGLAALPAVARVLATELTPFLPDAAARITGRCVSLAGPLAQPRPLFGTTHAGIG
jgi:hypothetical protein